MLFCKHQNCSLQVQTSKVFSFGNTVEPVFKGHPISHKNMVSLLGNRYNDACVLNTRPSAKLNGPSGQVVFHGSGLSREVSLYM